MDNLFYVMRQRLQSDHKKWLLLKQSKIHLFKLPTTITVSPLSDCDFCYPSCYWIIHFWVNSTLEDVHINLVSCKVFK